MTGVCVCVCVCDITVTRIAHIHKLLRIHLCQRRRDTLRDCTVPHNSVISFVRPASISVYNRTVAPLSHAVFYFVLNHNSVITQSSCDNAVRMIARYCDCTCVYLKHE